MFIFVFFSLLLSFAKLSAACPPPGTGLDANGTTVTESGCTVTTTTNFGAIAQNSGTLNFSDGTITTTGANAWAAFSTGTGSVINFDNIIINTSGSGAIGSYSFQGAITNMTGGSITTTGDSAYGAIADSGGTSDIGTANMTGVDITTQGISSAGFFVNEGGVGLLRNGSISASGSISPGISMSTTTGNNQMTVDNSTVGATGFSSQAILMFASSGNNQLTATNNTTFSAAQDDLIIVQNGVNNFDFTSVTAEAATGHRLLNVINISNPSIVTFNANSSTLSGDMVVNNTPTNQANVFLRTGTEWTGAAINLNGLDLEDIGTTWNLTANSNVNQLVSMGLIDFVSQGNIFKTLTVSQILQGKSGTFGLNTFLGTDGSPSDEIILNGATAFGTSFLDIKNTTGPGAETVGDGILVVDAINGATTTTNAFALSHPVIAGPYQYNLFRGDISGLNPDSWYLRSMLAPIPVPSFRAEASLYSALPSMALLYGRALLGTLHEREGEERFSRPCHNEKLWVRVLNQGGLQNNGGIFKHGPDFGYQFVAIETGSDLYRYEGRNGSFDCFGILGAIGTGHGQVEHFDELPAGKDEFDAYTGGVYWTHFGASGWYLDAVVQGNWFSNMEAHSENVVELDTHGFDGIGSLEGGYPFRYGRLVLEPQAQFVYQNLFLHDSGDIGAEVDFRRTHSTAARVGVRALQLWNTLAGWLRTSVWHDFQGNSRTFFSSADGPVGIPSDLGGTWIEADVGATAQLGRKLWFYGSFGGNVYLNGHGESYTAVAGFRTCF